MQFNIDDKLYNGIKSYCELNNLIIEDYINVLLKKQFNIDRYGEKPNINSQKNYIPTESTVSVDEPIGDPICEPIDEPIRNINDTNNDINNDTKSDTKNQLEHINIETLTQVNEPINALINEPIKKVVKRKLK